MIKSQVKKDGTFLYFAYGANIWSFRIHMHSPSAEFVSIARADNYRLAFHTFNKFWVGPEATMVPTANAHVWGVIWRIDIDDLVSLDNFKGVNFDKYFVKYLDVLTPYMGYIHCRAYLQRVNPLPMGDHDPIPAERHPSWTYREVMITGAKENDFPPYYIEHLCHLQHNGQEAMFRVHCLCIRYGRDKPCQCFVPGKIKRKPLKLDWSALRAMKKFSEKQNVKKAPEKKRAQF